MRGSSWVTRVPSGATAAVLGRGAEGVGLAGGLAKRPQRPRSEPRGHEPRSAAAGRGRSGVPGASERRAALPVPRDAALRPQAGERKRFRC